MPVAAAGKKTVYAEISVLEFDWLTRLATQRKQSKARFVSEAVRLRIRQLANEASEKRASS